MKKSNRAILCVDDEQNVLNALKRLLRKEDYTIFTAVSGRDGLKILEENEVNLVISDQRMPEMSGTEFLSRVKEAYPDIIRIILTGYAEIDSITESINKGQIYKLFFKPWNDQSIKLEILQALDQYALVKANRELSSKVVKQNEKLKLMNKDMASPEQTRIEELICRNQSLELSQTILENMAIPIVGVGAEGMVIMYNKAAESVFKNKNPIAIGRQVQNFFAEDVVAIISQTLDTEQPLKVPAGIETEKKFEIKCTPMSGKFKGKGVVLAIC